MDRSSEDLAKLGLTAGASPDDIASAFRALAFAAHPDRGGDPAMMVELTEVRDRLLVSSAPPQTQRNRTDRRQRAVADHDFDDVRMHFYLVPMVLLPALALLVFIAVAW